MDGLRPCPFLKRGKPRRGGAPPPHPCTKPMRHQDSRKTNNQGKKALPAGLRPDSGTKRGTCRAWLIDGRGKAWSKRPDRQADRHGRKRPPLRGAKTGTNHARPTSRPPAQPGACARHARKVRGNQKTEKPVYQERGGPAPRTKRATAARRGRKARFLGPWHSQGASKARKWLCGPLVKSAGFAAPHHSPPPLASEGSESPSVVRDAGGGALRFLDCTPD